MLTRIDVRGRAEEELADLLPRPVDPGTDVYEVVSQIIARVRAERDAGLLALTRELDGVAPESIRVEPGEMAAALEAIPSALADALVQARDEILAFHEHGQAAVPEYVRDGVRVRHLVRPVQRAGCYAPGGSARYPSTVLMCAVPARVAGVKEVVLCVPPDTSGRIDQASLAAASLAGVDAVYAVGGAQAIAAMAYGTETVRPVDVIVGPGNRYVAEAKRQVSGVVGVSAAFAGPSEVVVVTGPDTPPQLAAIDLAVQAEHGPGGLAWLVTWSEDQLEAVDQELERVVASSPRRAHLEATLAAGGYACLVDDAARAVAVSNVVAPEHLELLFEGAAGVLDLVRSAGAVFVGPSTPASFGDYVAGPSHVLPTNRTARFASVLGVDDFRRHIHAVELLPPAVQRLGPAAQMLATTEGLPAHAQSISMRLGEGAR